MASDQAASVQGCALRVTQLDANGVPLLGPGNQFVVQTMIELNLAPNYEAGEEVVVKTAIGGLAHVDKAMPKLKWFDVVLTISNPDPDLTQALTGGTLLTRSGKTSGWISPLIGSTGIPGVVLEVWSRAIVGDSQVIGGQGPYFRWVFPKVQFTVDPKTLNNDAMPVAFTGFTTNNPRAGTKLVGDWPLEFVNGQPGYFRDTTVPTGITVFPPQHGYGTSAYGSTRYANAQ